MSLSDTMSVSCEQQDNDSNQLHPVSVVMAGSSCFLFLQLLCNSDLFDTRGDSSSDDEGPFRSAPRIMTPSPPPPSETKSKRRKSYKKSATSSSRGDKVSVMECMCP